LDRNEEQRGYSTSQEVSASSEVPSADGGEKEGGSIPEAKRPRREKKKKNKERSYGNLFKASSNNQSETKDTGDSSAPVATKVEENSEEYWNEERAKLGLKPLRN
jgi:hypothetical protein